MALPKKLKLMDLFNEGVSYFGQIGEVTIPKLARKLENWRGGGMEGNVKVDLGFGDDITTFQWKLGGVDPLILEQFGASTVAAHMLRFAGSYQRDDTAEIDAYEIVVRGRHEEIDFGNQKAGDDTETTIKTIWSYYKLSINGVVYVEIDIPSNKFIVKGVDRSAEHMKAIGH